RAASSRAASGRSGGDAGSHRAGDAGPAEAAIAAGVLRQVLLVVVLGEVEGRAVDDLGRDRPEALRGERLAVGRLRRLGGGALGGVADIDAGAVLGADVVPLPHALGRVMGLEERLEQAV